MKITKTQLTRIIKEEVKSITEMEWGRDIQARAHGGEEAQLQIELNDILRGLIEGRGLTKEQAEASIATVFSGQGTPQQKSLKMEVSREVRDQRKAELSARSARKARRGEHEDSIQNRIDRSKARDAQLSPGSQSMRDRAHRQWYREEPLGKDPQFFDNEGEAEGDWDKKKETWLDKTSKNNILPDEEREQRDLKDKVERLEAELQKLKKKIK